MIMISAFWLTFTALVKLAMISLGVGMALLAFMIMLLSIFVSALAAVTS